jgi:zinc transport system permease protein
LTRNLQAFLYGDPLAVTDAELLWMAGLFLFVCAYLSLLYNRILLLGIHEGFARTKVVRVPAVEISFALVVALVVTAAIHTVGILLVTALLVIPAAAARNVARGAASALWISVGVAALSGFAGIVASWYLDTATGATVVLAAAACFAVTALYRVARPRE